jgi:hypothetical protein
MRTIPEQTSIKRTAAMLAELRSLLAADPDALGREALGLAALVVAILAGFFLPALG